MTIASAVSESFACALANGCALRAGCRDPRPAAPPGLTGGGHFAGLFGGERAGHLSVKPSLVRLNRCGQRGHVIG